MLVAHNPVCKLPIEDRHQPSGHPQHQQQCAPLPLTMRPNLGTRAQMNQVVVKQEPEDDQEELSKSQHSVIKPICLGGSGVSGSMYCTDGDSLNTPVVAASTPAATPNAQSLIFTYPSMLEPESPSPSSESCSKAHRRSSSSGDQSSDSLNSPTLLALWARAQLDAAEKQTLWLKASMRINSAPPLQCLFKTQEHIQQSRPSWPCEPFPPLQGDPQGLRHAFLLVLLQCKFFFLSVSVCTNPKKCQPFAISTPECQLVYWADYSVEKHAEIWQVWVDVTKLESAFLIYIFWKCLKSHAAETCTPPRRINKSLNEVSILLEFLRERDNEQTSSQCFFHSDVSFPNLDLDSGIATWSVYTFLMLFPSL